MAVAKGGSEKMARLSTFQRDNGIFVRIKGIKGESARSTKGYTMYLYHVMYRTIETPYVNSQAGEGRGEVMLHLINRLLIAARLQVYRAIR